MLFGKLPFWGNTFIDMSDAIQSHEYVRGDIMLTPQHRPDTYVCCLFVPALGLGQGQ